MNARDELATVIHRRICEDSLSECLEEEGYCVKAAGELIAAGYRKPRTVTTFGELDALAVGAVVGMLDTGHVAIKSWQSKHPRKDGTQLSEWLVTGDDSEQGTYDLAFPATVLHEPEAAA